MPASTPSRLLDDAERAQYRADGYLVVRGLLEAREVEALQRATDGLSAIAKEFVMDTLVNGVFFEMQSASGRKGEPVVEPGALRKITGPSKGGAAFAQLRRDPRLLALVASSGLVRPRVVVDQVNLKHPLTGTGFPYHQDAAFLRGDAQRDLRAYGGLNLVIALDAADAENGGFCVLGGTHLQGLMRDQHGYDTSTTNEGVFDERGECVPALAHGDAVLFHPLLAHGSGRNLSSRRRRLVTLWTVASGA